MLIFLILRCQCFPAFFHGVFLGVTERPSGVAGLGLNRSGAAGGKEDFN